MGWRQRAHWALWHLCQSAWIQIKNFILWQLERLWGKKISGGVNLSRCFLLQIWDTQMCAALTHGGRAETSGTWSWKDGHARLDAAFCFHTWRGLKGCQNSSLKSGFTGWWRVRNRAFWSWTNPLVGPEASLTGEPKQVWFPHRLLYVWGGTKMKDEKFPELVWKTHVVYSLQSSRWLNIYFFH